LLGLLLLSPTCGNQQGEPVEDFCSLAAAQVLDTNDDADDSYVSLDAGTDIIPCSVMAAAYVPLGELPDGECLPCSPEKVREGDCLYREAYAITAIDVTPDGVRFLPAATLSYGLPADYDGPDTLFIYQHDPEATCDPPERTSWTIVSIDVATVRDTDDFADGPFDHTCIFALVDLQGGFNAMGRLTRPIELRPDNTLVVSLNVAGSSTNPELENQLVTFVLYGVQYQEGIEKLMSLLTEYFRPDTMLLMHHESDGNMVIWSDKQVVRFFVEKVEW